MYFVGFAGEIVTTRAVCAEGFNCPWSDSQRIRGDDSDHLRRAEYSETVFGTDFKRSKGGGDSGEPAGNHGWVSIEAAAGRGDIGGGGSIDRGTAGAGGLRE